MTKHDPTPSNNHPSSTLQPSFNHPQTTLNTIITHRFYCNTPDIKPRYVKVWVYVDVSVCVCVDVCVLKYMELSTFSLEDIFGTIIALNLMSTWLKAKSQHWGETGFGSGCYPSHIFIHIRWYICICIYILIIIKCFIIW